MHHTRMAKWIFAVSALSMVICIPRPVRAGMPPVPTPQFRSYGLHEGLPSSKVNVVAQDATGFVWVGTACLLYTSDAADEATIV